MTENENNNLLDECLKELHKITWDNSDNPTIIKNDVFNVWNKLLEYKMNKGNNHDQTLQHGSTFSCM